MKSLYCYTDYREYLKDFFAFKKANNSHYSLRTLSEQAGFKARDYLLRVMNNSRNLSEKGIRLVSMAMHHSEKEAIYPNDNFFSEIRKSIQVKSGSITLIDTIKLQRIPWVKPPKPENLIYTYDTTSDSLKLQWNPVNIENLLGYIVERRVEEAILETERMFTKDTVFTESLTSYQTGSNLNYIVRAVTIQNEESYPEGPISIIVTH